MGIRFDRDTRRATNGPMIFFSDSSSEQAFSEEIKGAVNSNLSFYSYRHPGDMMISFGSSEGFVEGVGLPGFVIGFFDSDKPYITIPYKGCNRNSCEGLSYSYPEKSTTFEEYKTELKAIHESLLSTNGGKIVAARVIKMDYSLDLGATFYSLSRAYPDAYIFCFGTPATGCWIGASPELMLKADNNTLNTMSLAGTRQAQQSGLWDEKNLEEQALVTSFIRDVFRNNSLTPEIGDTFTKNAGAIEHICTPVYSTIPPFGFNTAKLLKALSPTPAVSGFPREKAIEIIKKYESFNRGCYGGFCGPFHFDGDFCFNVILRCASVTEKNFNVYAGGGITLKSDLKEEWNETEIKASVFLNSAVRKQ